MRNFIKAPKRIQKLAVLVFAVSITQAIAEHVVASDWPVYGGDAGGSRHSRLGQVNPGNVDQLEPAWIFKTGEMAAGFVDEDRLSFQTTPIFWDGMLFFSSAMGHVFAVNAATGAELWRFDPAIPTDVRYAEFTSRGVSIWHALGEGKAQCSHRIFSGTLTGGLFALDALTGKPCESFASKGFLNLRTLANSDRIGQYTITSPPVVLPDILIVGSAIGDNGAVELDRGTVTAIDPGDGHILWRFDPIPRDPNNPARASWAGNSAAITGAANVWAPLSVDRENRLIYLPTKETRNRISNTLANTLFITPTACFGQFIHQTQGQQGFNQANRRENE